MTFADKIKRAIAYYFSVALFIALLPIVISYSLGYHIDPHTLKVYKTGILSLRSNPSGAFIYINGKLISDLTPARIENLKPGTYNVEVRREDFYPWQKEVVVRPNMATKVEEIVLFPLTKDIEKMGTSETIAFAVSEKNFIYHMAKDGLYRSNMDGTSPKKLSSFSNWPADISGKRFSADGNKLLYFDEKNIWVINLNPERNLAGKTDDIKAQELASSQNPIMDVFWYSDSRHIVFVTDKEIEALEAAGAATKNAVTLYRFKEKPADIYYDDANDTIYFIEGSCPYKLELRQKFLNKLMERFKKEFEIIYEKR
jgi:hypothetical protein